MIRTILASVLIFLTSNAAKADDMPPIGQFIEINGAQIRYHMEGEGPPVLLLHGASSNAEDMHMALAGHLDGYQAIYLDRPGLGWSERPNGAWNPQREAALIAEFLDELNIPDPIVVGHSWGGAIAMRMAIDHPQRLSGVITLGSPLYSGVGEAAWFNRASRIFGIGPIITRIIIPLVGPTRIDAGLAETFSPAPVPEGYAEAVHVNRIFHTDIFKANAADMAQVNQHLANQEGLYSTISIPVIMLGGLADQVVYTRRHAVPAAEVIPSAETVIEENWGHMLHHEDPQAVIDAIERLRAAE